MLSVLRIGRTCASTARSVRHQFVGTKVILVSTRGLHWPLSRLICRSCLDCDLFVVSPLTGEYRGQADRTCTHKSRLLGNRWLPQTTCAGVRAQRPYFPT